MAKTAAPKQVKNKPEECECGGERKWVKRANNNSFYWYCPKCDSYFTKHNVKKTFGS